MLVEVFPLSTNHPPPLPPCSCKAIDIASLFFFLIVFPSLFFPFFWGLSALGELALVHSLCSCLPLSTSLPLSSLSLSLLSLFLALLFQIFSGCCRRFILLTQKPSSLSKICMYHTRICLVVIHTHTHIRTHSHTYSHTPFAFFFFFGQLKPHAPRSSRIVTESDKIWQTGVYRILGQISLSTPPTHSSLHSYSHSA